MVKKHGPTPRKRPASEAPADPSESRYTAPTPKFRVRPKWHRAAGWFGVALGVVIVIVNDGMLIMDGARLLPGGHQELYLVLGVIVAGGSTWFLGAFDRGTTVYD